jgi:hypothetical protein
MEIRRKRSLTRAEGSRTYPAILVGVQDKSGGYSDDQGHLCLNLLIADSYLPCINSFPLPLKKKKSLPSTHTRKILFSKSLKKKN